MVFEKNSNKRPTMTDAHIRTRRYGSAVRGVPLHHPARCGPAQGTSNKMRRLGDLVIACLILAITLPLMIFVALAIKRDSPGPILDRQTCIGRGGRRFQMLKFRTTIYDPDHATPAWAQKTTRVGQFLRQTRIDALPQLINVLRGEMSLIDRDAGSPSFLD
jgi:lipopolysaccharide/colanic/teichoic acid biosynthesis glycosyltransferase